MGHFLPLSSECVKRRLICLVSAPELELCPYVMDIAFLMDSSGSLGTRDYKKLKYFVNRLVQSLNMTPDQSRGAIVIYGSVALVEAHFDQHKSTGDFQKKVHQLPYIRGPTRIDKGLEMTVNKILPHVRPEVVKIAVVLVEGRQSNASDMKSLKELSGQLRREGVRILAVGIGPDVDKNELQLMVESEQDIALAKDLDGLISKATSLAQVICIPGKHTIYMH